MNTENNNQTNVKFCTKCGTKAIEGDLFCANCGATVSENAQKTPENYVPVQTDEETVKSINNTRQKTRKKPSLPVTIIICTLILSITFLIAFYIYTDINSEVDIENCQHDWTAPTCVEPAQCFYCDAYKDEILGNHKFYFNEQANDYLCTYCDLSKTEYDANK